MTVRTWLARLAVVAALVLLAVSDTAPNFAAASDCAAVRDVYRYSPPGQVGTDYWVTPAWVLREVVTAPPSGIGSLDGAIHDMALASRNGTASAFYQASAQAVTACYRLNIWPGPYGWIGEPVVR